MNIKFNIGNIKEYDIRSANVSILASLKVIDDELYDVLDSSDKMMRNITIGNIIKKDISVYDILNKGIEAAVEKFIDTNEIRDNVIEVSKDAVFVIDADVDTTNFGEYIKFVNKNSYSAMVEVKRGEVVAIKLYISLDKIDNILTSRYGKLDVLSPLYFIISDLIQCKASSGDDYITNLKKLTLAMKHTTAPVCNTISNSELLTVLQKLNRM